MKTTYRGDQAAESSRSMLALTHRSWKCSMFDALCSDAKSRLSTMVAGVSEV